MHELASANGTNEPTNERARKRCNTKRVPMPVYMCVYKCASTEFVVHNNKVKKKDAKNNSPLD